MDDINEKKGFFSRLFSDDPTASSQRIIGTAGFIAAVCLAIFMLDSYNTFLWFSATMFVIKEGTKGLKAFADRSQQKNKEILDTPRQTKILDSNTDILPDQPSKN